MHHFFFARCSDGGFPHASKSARIVALAKAFPMASESEFTSEVRDGGSDATATGLRLSDFFWRPWYAKLWWSCALIVWVLALFAADIFSRDWLQANDGWITIAGLAFHPFVIVPVLGFPAVWAWRQTVVFPWDPGYGGESADDIEEELYGGESMGFGRRLKNSDLSDPNDPASPFNPANLHYRMRHGQR